MSWRSGVCSTSTVIRDTGGGFILEEDNDKHTIPNISARDSKNIEDNGKKLTWSLLETTQIFDSQLQLCPMNR